MIQTPEVEQKYKAYGSHDISIFKEARGIRVCRQETKCVKLLFFDHRESRNVVHVTMIHILSISDTFLQPAIWRVEVGARL